MTAPGGLSWAMCIPTLNRPDVLIESMSHVIAQTVPPKQIIIVDASDDFSKSQAAVAELVTPTGIDLHYVAAEKRSIAVQRNQAIRIAAADVCVLFDDDTFMYPDCAEELLKAYAFNEAIVGVSATDAPPQSAGRKFAQKQTGQRARAIRKLRETRLVQWIWREVFLMSTFRTFIAFDSDGERYRENVDTGEYERVSTMTGYKMTGRADTLRREQFDRHLLAYSPCEDTDASYRLGRHGVLVRAPLARVHHFEAAAGRLRRRRATSLFLLNNAYFVRRSSRSIAAHRRQYYLLTIRRLLAEFLKDGLSKRWTFPQFRGVMLAIPALISVLNYEGEELGAFYEGVQSKVLNS